MAKLPNHGGMIGPRIRHGVNNFIAEPEFVPFSRAALMAGIAAAWSLVVAVPLFASVGLQSEASIPPPSQIDRYDSIVRTWEPPTWEAQRARFTPDKANSADPSVSMPFVRQSLIDRWPQPEWDTQQTRKTPIPDVHDSAPFVRQSLIDRWPQPEWDTQQTRKTPIPDAVVVVVSVPFSRQAYQPLSAWQPLTVTPLWTSQGTQDAPTPLVYTDQSAQPIALWTPLTWETQQTRKTPIPDASAAPTSVPFSRASSFPIRTWEPVEWTVPSIMHAPIPDASAAPANVPFSRVSSTPIRLWSPADWTVQRTTQGIPLTVSDAPPFGRRLWTATVLSSWEPGPPDPIRRRVVGTPSGPDVITEFYVWHVTRRNQRP